MAYTKQTWADLPSKTTPINANRLTHIEDGIFNAAQTADTAASTAGTAAANVGIVSSKVETLTERVNGLDTAVSNKVDKVTGKGLSTNDYDDTDKGKVDSLGTASTKNSTSVVTESSDLVESGAVKDIVGWGNKNLYDLSKITSFATTGTINYAKTDNVITINASGVRPTVRFSPNISKADNYTLSYSVVSVTNVVKTFIGFVIKKSDETFRYEQAPNSTSAGDYTKTITLAEGETIFAIDININDKSTSISDLQLVVENIQLEKGSTATAYEPYHASVEESLAEKADNSVIGTVEDGTNPTKSYAVDEFMVRDGAFCQVTAPVTTSSTWTEGSNYTKKSIAEVLQSLMS